MSVLQLSALPPFPGMDDDADQFEAKSIAFVLALSTIIPQWNQSVLDVSELYTTILSLVNFKGQWGELVGELTVPASCYHNGSYWQLIQYAPNVTSEEPGGASDNWVPVNGLSSLPLSGGTMTGPIIGLKEMSVNLDDTSSEADIELGRGNVFTKIITENQKFWFCNPLESPNVNEFWVDLTNGGNYAITFGTWNGEVIDNNIQWVGGVQPELTFGGRDILGFESHDGGATWVGGIVFKDVR
jgi:hypothetical protein